MTFYRPDGDTEEKDISWCVTNDFLKSMIIIYGPVIGIMITFQINVQRNVKFVMLNLKQMMHLMYTSAPLITKIMKHIELPMILHLF